MIEVERAFLRNFLEAEAGRSLPRANWTVQGFGMVRTYLDGDQRWRLNIWDERLATMGANRIHDHPWDFVSTILCGCIVNRRFVFRETAAESSHQYKEIVTGPDGYDASEPKHCLLMPTREEIYRAGYSYKQRRDEVHETIAEPGTVTINDRSPPSPGYKARVFWPSGYSWTAARPRPATSAEVAAAIEAAMVFLR